MGFKSFAKGSALAIILLAGVAQLLIMRTRRSFVPPEHLLGHPVVYEQNVIPEDVADQLDTLMKELATFPVGRPVFFGRIVSGFKPAHLQLCYRIYSVQCACR